MVAVLANAAEDEALSAPVRVNVTVAPTGRSTSSSIAATPLESAHAPPAAAVHDQVTPLSTAGGMSDTVAPVMSDGPLFVATIW
jgi:hypothetical protein